MFKMDREFYIPKGATKVASKNSDAVAYVYDIPTAASKFRFGALMFFGKAAKPVWHHTFTSAAAREQKISASFAGKKAHDDAKAKYAAERKAQGAGLVVGDTLVASWGYEQTNVDFYQVTEVTGKMVTVRKIAGRHVRDTARDQGVSAPDKDNFIGEPMRRLARNGAVKIDDSRRAYKCAPDSEHRWSSYY